ncbi:MAG: hypothetical protein ACYDBJ_10130 [Aggregatilineales bacterium]
MQLSHWLNQIVSCALSALLIAVVSGCRPPDEPLPTLIPSLIPSLVPPTAVPTVPTSTPAPSALPSLPPTSTIVPASPVPPSLVPITSEPVLPPAIVTANGTLTITLTEAQLNDALAKRFATQPIAGYAGPPHASLRAGAIELTITLVSGTPSAPLQSATLTLTLAALPTVSGTVLDVRAVKLSKSDAISTLQVKPAQTLLTTTLESLIEQATGLPAGTRPIEFNYVAVSPDKLTLTVLTS